MKKFLALLLAVMMLLSMVACTNNNVAPETDPTDPTDPPAPEKQVINLWAFTDEVPNMVKRYMELHPDFAEKYELKTTIIATTNGEYQPALDAALASGGADAPDIYCAEGAFILKYSQGDAAAFAAAYDDLGLNTAAAIKEADIAQYSVEIGTRPSDGKVVGLGYQATGGAFIYRSSIAKDVWGTDDAAEIGEILGAGTQSWDKFWEAAAALKAKGYAIVSGDGDIWHAVENSSDAGWLNDGALVIDAKREAFLDISKTLTDKGYSNLTTDWTDAWYADMKGAGEKQVFGFFGPAWLINYTMAGNSGGEKAGEGTYGDWRVCASPVGFYWGGTWLLANKDTDVKEGVAEIINWITLDCTKDGLQYGWANGTWSGEAGTKDSVASGTVMSMSDGSLEFLGGQNMFDAFVPANAYANGKNLTQYDEKINSLWRDQVKLYAAGEIKRDDAIAAFKQNVADNLDVTVD